MFQMFPPEQQLQAAHLEAHDAGQAAEVPDGGVRHGQVVGRHRGLPTGVAAQRRSCGDQDT